MPQTDHNANDRALLERFAKGDASAMDRLLSRYSDALVNYTSYMLSHDRHAAEDIVQDSFVKLWQHTDRLLANRDKLYVRAWLFQVCRNAALDRLRRAASADGELDDKIVDGQPLATEVVERDQRARSVMEWINELPERQRSALLMAHFETISNPEIARIMDTSVEAVENLLARARRSLRARAEDMKEVI